MKPRASARVIFVHDTIIVVPEVRKTTILFGDTFETEILKQTILNCLVNWRTYYF